MKTDDGYLSIRDLVQYSGLSRRTLGRYFAARRDPLPHHRVGRRVLVRRDEFDAWVARHHPTVQAAAAPDDDDPKSPRSIMRRMVEGVRR